MMETDLQKSINESIRYLRRNYGSVRAGLRAFRRIGQVDSVMRREDGRKGLIDCTVIGRPTAVLSEPEWLAADRALPEDDLGQA